MKAKKYQQDGRSKKRPGLEEQKRAITDAAVELFIEYGSRAVSISQICDRANVSRPTFYRCFVDKDELIYDLYQYSVNEHVEEIMLKGIKAQGVDEAWIQQALNTLLDSIFEHSRLAELVFMESNDPNSPAYEIVNSAFEHVADVLEKTLTQQAEIKLSRVYLKSVMAANQWLVHDAIRSGLSDKVKAEAKNAAWQLVKHMLIPLTEKKRKTLRTPK